MHTKCCPRCGNIKPLLDFGKCRPTNPRGAFKDGRTYECRECHNASRRAWAKAHRAETNATNNRYHARYPEFQMWVSAKARAKERGQPFTISRDDVITPSHCPVLGIPLLKGDGKCGPNSPSLDCIIPALGYVPGNIVVMSHKANTMKSNATLDELKSLTSWMESQLGCYSAPHIEAQAA